MGKAHRRSAWREPLDPEEEKAFWEKAVFVRSGGLKAAREALAEKRRQRGERGPQKAPTKMRVTLRLSQEVVRYFKAKGAGWQTRVDEALKAFITTLK